MSKDIESFGLTSTDAEVKVVVLRGCFKCGAKHPLVYNPPVDSKNCLECGYPVEEPDSPVYVKAVVTDHSISGFVASMLIRLGGFLNKLSRRVK